MQSCLVICATKATMACDVAVQIANTLRLHGVAVDLSCRDGVTDLAPYDAIVIGAPLSHGRWLRTTRQFLKHNRAVLESKDVALFIREPCRCEQGAYDRVWNRVIHLLRRLDWLTPVRMEVFTYESPVNSDCCRQGASEAVARWCHSLEVAMHLTNWDVPNPTGLV
jgi:menaquinone-dependent protoporphyrinogen IX oxidase